MSDFLTQLQDDLEGLLLSDPRLAEIPVLVERKGITEDDVANAIGVFNTRPDATKTGLVIVVTMPGIETPNGGNTMLQFKTTCAIKVFELPVVNLSATGHGTAAESIAVQILDLTHHWSLAQGRTLTPDSNAVAPTNAPEDHVGYDVNLVWQDGLEKTPRAPRPTITYDEQAEQVTITSTDEGAALYYTTDGSFPYPGNPASTLYNTPVTYQGVIVTHEDGNVTTDQPFIADSSIQIRAIAIRAGYLPSNLKSITLSEIA